MTPFGFTPLVGLSAPARRKLRRQASYRLVHPDGRTERVWREGREWWTEHPDGDGKVGCETLKALRLVVSWTGCTIEKEPAR